MQNGTGREVVIVEAVRTPIGRGHPEKGYYRDTHPNTLLGACLTEAIQPPWTASADPRSKPSTSVPHSSLQACMTS